MDGQKHCKTGEDNPKLSPQRSDAPAGAPDAPDAPPAPPAPPTMAPAAADAPGSPESSAPAAPLGIAPLGAEQQARVLQDLVIASTLTVLLGNPDVDTPGAQRYLEQFRKEAGEVGDPVLRSLIDQFVSGHFELARLRARVSGFNQPEQMKMAYGVVARLSSEQRRLALAIREYRAPYAHTPVAVFNQQNVLAGSESNGVSPAVTSSPRQKELAAQGRGHTVVNENEQSRGGDHGRVMREAGAKEPSARRRRPGERTKTPPVDG